MSRQIVKIKITKTFLKLRVSIKARVLLYWLYKFESNFIKFLVENMSDTPVPAVLGASYASRLVLYPPFSPVEERATGTTEIR